MTLGSLSNDDGNGNENITRKDIFISYVLLRDYFNSLNFYKNGELSSNQIGRSGVQVKGWFPYDRGSQIAMRSAIVCDHMETYFCDSPRSCDHDGRQSQKIEPCSISCDRLRSDHLQSIAIVRSYGNQSFAIRDRNASHNILRSLPRFNTRVFYCRNSQRYGCVYYRSRKDFNDKSKKASYWDKIGQKIHLSAGEEAEAKFLQH